METAPFLRNRYWILRHGKSIPNEKGLIVSSMENGTLPEYQLAAEGGVQAQLAGELFQKELKENNVPLEKVIADLRERYFGPSLELKSHEKYAEIWSLDEKDPFQRPEGGECVDDVASRLAIAMANIESEFQGCAVLVVSHGDPLQIFQTIINAVKEQASGSTMDSIDSRVQQVRIASILSQHRKFALDTGELRALA
ncbi:hypothetical protein CDL15_Pgr019773 [Punica granatum]|uniref:Phosphoglycerate mutase-like protein 4 n=1 Tax=Punica granatum TaxID=22663 RepID=A0A218X6E1_PUNGR|nr:hypothetical protein CDL15_Pgr019773 [Punica granatum]